MAGSPIVSLLSERKGSIESRESDRSGIIKSVDLVMIHMLAYMLTLSRCVSSMAILREVSRRTDQCTCPVVSLRLVWA